jgi:hypothetical protein
MSVSSLYIEKKSAFAPPANQSTYEQFVFNMEKNGTNDLVERDMVDPTFRPPLVSDSYQANTFERGSNLL